MHDLHSSQHMTACLNQLKRNGLVRHAEWFDELDSTNTRAAALGSQEGIELPRLIGAVRQTAGRGRGQNAWWSADGALTFSLLFNPLEFDLPFLRWPQVALATGLAVADTLEEFLPPTNIQLKWPNDVYVSGKKIAGILTEVPGGQTDRLVVGIGINVHNSLQTAPLELQATADSLTDLLGDRCPALETVLMILVDRWTTWLRRLAAEQIDFPTLWRTKCFLTGHTVTVAIGSELQTGLCLGLDHDGALLLNSATGPKRILAGTVRRHAAMS